MVISFSLIDSIGLSNPVSDIYYLVFIRYLLYKGSISWPYVSRLRIDGHDTIKLGTIPDSHIGI